jgi:hypothetical protein
MLRGPPRILGGGRSAMQLVGGGLHGRVYQFRLTATLTDANVMVALVMFQVVDFYR